MEISFVDVHHLRSPDRIVVIDLEGAHLRHLYVEPSDGSAEQVAERIQRELQGVAVFCALELSGCQVEVGEQREYHDYSERVMRR